MTRVKKLFNMGTGQEFVQVKAWAAINNDGDMYSVWLPIHKGKRHRDVYKPCTITIEAKYLKGKQ